MPIVEKPDPAEQLQFLKNAISEWKWAVFPLQPIKRGWKGTPVFCACHKGLRCKSTGKHPLINWTDLTKYPPLDRVRELLAAGVTGWGVHLGWSDQLALDVDPRNGGDESLSRLKINDAEIRDAIATGTGGGGMHVFLKASTSPFTVDPIRGVIAPDGTSSTSMQLLPGLELLSGQHFVVATYSPHKSGAYYRNLRISNQHL